MNSMTLVLTEDHRMLRDAARRFLSGKAPVSQLRTLRDSRDSTGFSTALWSDFAATGYAGMLVPESFGGSGLGMIEAGLVMEQIGHNLCALPFLASSVVAAGALLHAGDQSQQRRWLPQLASGTTLATLALDEGPKHRPEWIETRAVRAGDGWQLDGSKCFVLDGHVADLLIVAARTSGSSRQTHGITLFVVPRAASGVAVERTIMVDSHNAARVTLRAVKLSSDALLGPLDGGWPALEAALNGGRAAAAAELLGIADEVFQRTLDYLRQRRQFGRPIGEFQALQHRAAALYVEIELGRAALLAALAELDRNGAATASDAVGLAKARCGRTAMLAVQESVQMHGGIGMTDELEIGFFMKRARVLQELFGDADFQLDQLAKSRRY